MHGDGYRLQRLGACLASISFITCSRCMSLMRAFTYMGMICVNKFANALMYSVLIGFQSLAKWLVFRF